MTARKVIPLALSILFVAIASSVFLVERKEARASVCAVCDRSIHPAWAFTLKLTNGKEERLCCPKCGLLTQMELASKVSSSIATDFVTEKTLPADKALYVWNSNVEHYQVAEKRDWADQEPMKLVWDRCSPSLIAFASRDEAEKFQSQHGGKILDYQESIALLKSSSTPPAP